VEIESLLVWCRSYSDALGAVDELAFGDFAECVMKSALEYQWVALYDADDVFRVGVFDVGDGFVVVGYRLFHWFGEFSG